jgi:hypothetical protein
MTTPRASIASLALVVACGCTVRVNDSRVAVQGPESWHDVDRTYEIAGTYYRRGNGNTVWYVIVTKERPSTVSPTETKKRALPLIRYAYEHQLHERTKILPLRGMDPPLIGFAVELTSPAGDKVLDSYEVPGGEVTWRLAHPDEP